MPPLHYVNICVLSSILPLAAAEAASDRAAKSIRTAATERSMACTEVPASAVNPVPHGFFLEALDTFVPQDHVQPSSDGRYWHCAVGHDRTLLLVPRARY